MFTQPMLAATPKKPEDWSRMPYPALVSPKLDGIRVLIRTLSDGSTHVHTRKLIDIPNAHVRKLLAHPDLHGLDGELLVHDEHGSLSYPGVYNQTSSGVMSHGGEPEFVFAVFDDFSCGSAPFSYRIEQARNRVSKLAGVYPICMVEHVDVTSREHLETISAQFLEQGYEGAMYRNPASVYKCGRSTMRESGLVKIKEFHDEEARITGFEEKYSNQNEATTDERGYTKRSSHAENQVPCGTLGALQVTGTSGNFTGVEFKIGSGFNDELRREIWDNQDRYLGRIVTFKYQPFGVKDKPRFPIFLRFRQDS